jgi:RNA polymerase sigma factor (sigma-70 family)
MPDWQEILRRDGPAVWQTGYRLLGNRADADECFQETFLAALEVSRRGQVQHWRALLQRLATARAVDCLRERRRRGSREQAADLSTVCGSEPQPAQSAEDAELSERLRTALARIPRKQAQVFYLHCIDGWSYQEIARHLEISINAVGVLLHRGRKQLRQLMGARHEISQPARHVPTAGLEPENP